jgi:phage terminase large subunit
MLAALLVAVDGDRLIVESEYCCQNLTLSEAAKRVAELSGGLAEYAVASPDLWNRRQDSGKSGFEIMQSVSGMPPMSPADNRRIPGWRVLREYLGELDGIPRLRISHVCHELIRCLPALLFDPRRPEDAAGEPHSVTHAPEALRYAVMSRHIIPDKGDGDDFIIPIKKRSLFFD